MLCDSGERARITFPDGTVQEFTDTPITVESTKLPAGELGTSGGLYYKTAGSSSFTYYNGQVYGAVFDVYVYSHPPFWTIQSLSNTNSATGDFSPTPGTRNHGTTTFETVVTDWYFLPDGGIPLRPKYEITVTGNSGNQLFQQVFETDQYSFECLAGCPPGTLDCGDCCLDCQQVHTQLVSIRVLLNSIN